MSEKGVYSWDLETGGSHLLFGGDRVRNALSLSPDGHLLASIAGDGVALWDAKTGRLVQEFDESFSASTVAFQPGGQGVIVFREKSIESRSLDGKTTRIVGESPPFHKPAFAANGKWFATSAPDKPAGEILIYDAQSLRKKAALRVGPAVLGQAPNTLPMLRAGFSADGRRLAVPGAFGSIAIWDVGTGKVVQLLKPAAEKRRPEENDCRYLLFTQDARQLFAGTAAGTIRRWDMATGKELAPLRGHRDAVRSLHLTRGDTRLVSTSADGMIRRWDVAMGKEFEPPDGYSGGSLHAHLSPKGESVLLLDSAGRMDIWDLSKGRLRTPIRAPGDAKLDTPWVEPLFGFTPDGNRVFLAERNGKISTYDARSGQPAGSLALSGYGDQLTALRFCISTPDGQAFVINRGMRRLRLIRASNGNDIWESPDVAPRGIGFPPVISGDGKSILQAVTTLEDKPYTELRGKLELVRLDLASGKVVARHGAQDQFGGRHDLLRPTSPQSGRPIPAHVLWLHGGLCCRCRHEQGSASSRLVSQQSGSLG